VRRATDPPLELDSPAVRAAVDELMAASGYHANDAARIIRGAAALVRELARDDCQRVAGRLFVRFRLRHGGRTRELEEVQHDVTTRVL